MGEHAHGQEHLLKDLVSTFRCQYCRRSFERDHVRITARHEQLWIVSVRCSLCRNQQVFWVALKENETVPPRDVSPAEEERFAALAAVSSDDVLDIHQFLDGFDGDFKRLLEE